MKKNLLIYVLCFIVLSSNISMATSLFSDVDNEHWAKDNIDALVELGIINGFTDNTFRPSDIVTIEQFIKMVVLALDKDVRELEDGEHWSNPYIEKAYELGLIDNQDNFYNISFNGYITREWMADVVMRTFDKDELEVSLYEIEQSIIDSEDIMSELAETVYSCYGLGILTGYPDGTFLPQGNLTRAEATTVIMRLIDESLRDPYVVSVELTFEDIINDAEIAEQISGLDRLTFNDDGTITYTSDFTYTTTLEQAQIIKSIITNVVPVLEDDRDFVTVYCGDNRFGTPTHLGVSVSRAKRSCFNIYWNLNNEWGAYNESVYDDYSFIINFSSYLGYNESLERFNTYYTFLYAINDIVNINVDDFYNYTYENKADYEARMELYNSEGCVTTYSGDYRVDYVEEFSGADYYFSIEAY